MVGAGDSAAAHNGFDLMRESNSLPQALRVKKCFICEFLGEDEHAVTKIDYTGKLFML